jgi:transcriptional regulator with XRE-family HTH domain
VNIAEDVGRSDYSAGALRVLLAKTGVNATELGARIGTSKSWVSGRATGRYAITDPDAARICKGLGVGLSELMAEPPWTRLRKLAPVLQDVQEQIVDDPFSTEEEVQWLLRTIREFKDAILSNPNRSSRKPRARKL